MKQDGNKVQKKIAQKEPGQYVVLNSLVGVGACVSPGNKKAEFLTEELAITPGQVGELGRRSNSISKSIILQVGGGSCSALIPLIFPHDHTLLAVHFFPLRMHALTNWKCGVL